MKTLEKIYFKAGLIKPQYKENNVEDTKEIKFPEGVGYKQYKFGDSEFVISLKDMKSISEQQLPRHSAEEYKTDEFTDEDKELLGIYSSKIEGEDLSENKLKELKAKKKEQDVQKEIDNINKQKTANLNALNYLLNFGVISHGIMFDLYNSISNNQTLLDDEKNRIKPGMIYRHDSVGIWKQEIKILEGVKHEKVYNAMNDFISMASNITTNFVDILEAAAALHLIFETIHPFFDFNGRIGRLFITWVLGLSGHAPLSVSVIDIISNNKSKYYRALMDSQRTKNAAYFYSFFKAAWIEAIILHNMSIKLKKMGLKDREYQFSRTLFHLGILFDEKGYAELKNGVEGTRQTFDNRIKILIEKEVISKVPGYKVPKYKFSKEVIDFAFSETTK